MINFLLKTIRSVLNQTEFSDLQSAQAVDFEKLYSFSKGHHLAAFVGSCPNVLAGMPEDTAKKFIYEKNRSMAREATQEILIGEFLSRMDKAGLRAMPLKGYFIKNLYPSPSLRYMTDTDILVDKEHIESISQILGELGFSLEHETIHEVIFSGPQLVIELHKTLVPANYKVNYRYYENCWRFAKVLPGYKNIFSMSPEDSYVYSVAHIARHYIDGGIGIKHIADIYVQIKQPLDWDYINRELEVMNISKFSELLLSLAKHWFSDTPVKPDKVISEMEMFILKSGAYGSVSQRNIANVSKNAKGSTATTAAKIVLRKIFPTFEGVMYLYPILKKHPYLYPIFSIIRIFKILFSRQDEIRGFSQIRKVNQEQLTTFEEHCKKVGLSDNIY